MQWIDLFLWYLWAQAFGLGGSLLASTWLRHLPDRGYAAGKAAGLVLGGFVYWLSITLGFATNNVGAALLGLAAVWAAALWGLGAPRWNFAAIREALPARAVIVSTELVFALSFAGWAYFRALTPEIFDSGGEKFMESMMINAIVRAPSFPPNDAWLNGLSLSYYYFGYVLFAVLIKVSGVAPAIAFNLGGALVFALTATGAYGLGLNLWMAAQQASGKLARKAAPAPRVVGSLADIA